MNTMPSLSSLLLLVLTAIPSNIEAFTISNGPSTKLALSKATRSSHYPSYKHEILSLRSSSSDEPEKSTAATNTVPSPPSPPSSSSTSLQSSSSDNDITSRLAAEAQEIFDSASLAFKYLTQKDSTVAAEDIVKLCDEIEALPTTQKDSGELFTVSTLNLRLRSLKLSRYYLLNKMLKTNYDAYIATASFLSPSRIPRMELPNVQDVPYPEQPIMPKALIDEEDGKTELVADCTLEDLRFQESPLDKLLLSIFRSFVEKNTGGITSSQKGIKGLLEQGRTYMVQPNQTPEAQQKMVYDTLGGLMTPALPPFYRIFMSGIVPKLGTDYDGKQFGPWFYAPWLTSFVTPTFFGFLVGPSKPNSRKDGMPGGLVVEKCKFLQESGCKGMCLNMCKLPAQQFFKEELGLDLTVSPNFVTQECQWSFGEVPLPPKDDPSFPKGCLAGCESRKVMAGRGSGAQLMCE